MDSLLKLESWFTSAAHSLAIDPPEYPHIAYRASDESPNPEDRTERTESTVKMYQSKLPSCGMFPPSFLVEGVDNFAGV
jgi:hypothetical protein